MVADTFQPDAALLPLLAEPAVHFHGTGEFTAFRAAERFAKGAGFSLGATCVGHPVCLMFGEWMVAKWRNLTPREREACHAVLSGDRRSGPVEIKITAACPAEGRARFLDAASELEGLS